MLISIIFITPRKVNFKFTFSNTKLFKKEFIFFPFVSIVLYTIIGMASKSINSVSQLLILLMLGFTILVGSRIWKSDE
jgi:hypothetical protein